MKYDALGPLSGFRYWYATQHGLRSPLKTFFWNPTTFSTALCGDIENTCPASIVPAVNCTCGFYAFKSMEELLDETPKDFEKRPDSWVILGEVLLWGSVIEHRYGYRAQYAKVNILYDWGKPPPEFIVSMYNVAVEKL